MGWRGLDRDLGLGKIDSGQGQIGGREDQVAGGEGPGLRGPVINGVVVPGFDTTFHYQSAT